MRVRVGAELEKVLSADQVASYQAAAKHEGMSFAEWIADALAERAAYSLASDPLRPSCTAASSEARV